MIFALDNLTSSGGIVTGHLAQVGEVLYCLDMGMSAFIACAQSPSEEVKYTMWNKTARTLEEVLVVRFARKNSPDMFRASQRTTTIFCPLSSCFATVLARRPSRCPLPSMITCPWRCSS